MDKKKNHENYNFDQIRHIFDWNQNLIQMADTKVSVLLAVNAIIISLSSAWNIDEYGDYSRICVILAIILSVFSSLMLLLTMFPRLPKNVQNTVIFYKGILDYSQNEYVLKMTKITDEELYKDYSNSIYYLALIQKKKFNHFILGFLLLVLAIFLIALPFVFENIGVI